MASRISDSGSDGSTIAFLTRSRAGGASVTADGAFTNIDQAFSLAVTVPDSTSSVTLMVELYLGCVCNSESDGSVYLQILASSTGGNAIAAAGELKSIGDGGMPVLIRGFLQVSSGVNSVIFTPQWKAKVGSGTLVVPGSDSTNLVSSFLSVTMIDSSVQGDGANSLGNVAL